MSICVSVVVPTCRRPAALIRCLDALSMQDFESGAYEVIVVDDGADDSVRCLVERWADDVRMNAGPACVRYVRSYGNGGPAVARNIGWQVARGDIIAFTDDDCVPDPHWLRAGVAAFEDGVIGVSGRIVMPLPEHPTDYELNAVELEQAEFATANCFYRRDVLARVGGFDEDFSIAWREDSDLFFTLLTSADVDGALVHAPDARVMHPIRPASWGISLKQQRKSMFNALLYKKFPKLYREKLQSTPPWHYYRIVSALLTAAIGLASRRRRLTIAAFVGWLVLTARFCLQRLQNTSRDPMHVAEMIVTSILIPPLSVFWRVRGAVRFRVWFL